MPIKWLLLLVLLGLSSLNPTVAQEEDELEDEIMDEDEELDEENLPPAPEDTPSEPVERPDCIPPVPKGKAHFSEAFDSIADFESRWVQSKATKDDTEADLAKYDGKWSLEEPKDNPLNGDLGLVLKSRAKHHAISAKLDKPFDFSGDTFVAQYEVKFQNGQECGGAYIKLLSQEKKVDLTQFFDKTPYTIMFGPDKCGNDNKLHFIFRHRNPKTGTYEEKHAKKPTGAIDSFFTDKKTHLFTLVIHSDNSFEIYVDQNLVNQGNLLEDVEPPVNPAKEIVDPDDKKPADWDEREKIADPDAVKPDDWDETQPEMITDPDAVKPEGWLDDEPELIPDPDAEKPSDWDDDMDGEWEAPMISNPACESAPGCGEWEAPQIKNPAYKGKWKAPMIENPNYKGKWKARKIPNPDFFEDLEPFKMTPIAAVGLELWSMSDDIYFDNFIITDDKSVADQFAADSWELKNEQEQKSSSGKSVVQAVLDATNERPWLWAVFILVVVLPIVLVIAYCCMSGPKPEDIARHKKTDEPTADDDVVEEDEQKEGKKEDEGAGGDANTKKDNKKSKGDLEAEDDNEADVEDEEETEKPETRSSPRKRKGKPQKE